MSALFAFIIIIPTLIAIKLLTRVIMNDSLTTNTLPANSLFEVLWLELTVLIVTIRLLDGDLDDVEDIGGLLEDGVHFLQGTVACFWEEEVDCRKHKEIAVTAVSHIVDGLGNLISYITAKMI